MCVSLDCVNLAENNYTFLIQPAVTNFFGSFIIVEFLLRGRSEHIFRINVLIVLC